MSDQTEPRPARHSPMGYAQQARHERELQAKKQEARQANPSPLGQLVEDAQSRGGAVLSEEEKQKLHEARTAPKLPGAARGDTPGLAPAEEMVIAGPAGGDMSSAGSMSAAFDGGGAGAPTANPPLPRDMAPMTESHEGGAGSPALNDVLLRQEALHMAAFLSSAVDEQLRDHAAVIANPRAHELAVRAADALGDLYQVLGAV